MRVRGWLITCLIVLNVVTGIAVVYATFATRQLFGELQALAQQYQELKTDYSELLLEKSAWSAAGRIEEKAREDLGMTEPDEDSIKILEKNRD